MKQLFIIAAVAALAACSGGTSTTPMTCNGILYSAFTMTNPTAGSTGVADSMPELIFEGALATSQFAPPSVTVTSASGFTYTSTTFSPITTIDGPPGQFYGVTLPKLSAATTYSVTYTFQLAPTSFGTCGGPRNVTEGSFTTQ